jgi:hypothetical protein
MSDVDYVAPMDRRWPIQPVPQLDDYVPPEVSYTLLEESPDRIECWTKLTSKNKGNVFQVFTIMVVNSMYVEKAVGWKWDPHMKALAEENIAERDAISFKHMTKDRTETNLVLVMS